MLDPKFHSTSKFLARLSIVLSVILFAASTAQAAYDRDTPMSKTRNGDIEIAYLSVGAWVMNKPRPFSLLWGCLPLTAFGTLR